MEWKIEGSNHILAEEYQKDDGTGVRVFGYVQEYGGKWKVRKLNPAKEYFPYCLKKLVFTNWPERVVVCENKNTLDEAKDTLLKELGIVQLEPGKENIMKFLAQLKNVEVFGKIEVVIQIEGYPENKG